MVISCTGKSWWRKFKHVLLVLKYDWKVDGTDTRLILYTFEENSRNHFYLIFTFDAFISVIVHFLLPLISASTLSIYQCIVCPETQEVILMIVNMSVPAIVIGEWEYTLSFILAYSSLSKTSGRGETYWISWVGENNKWGGENNKWGGRK